MKNVQKGGDRVSLLSILKPTEILSDRCLQSVEIVGEVPSLDLHWMITEILFVGFIETLIRLLYSSLGSSLRLIRHSLDFFTGLLFHHLRD